MAQGVGSKRARKGGRFSLTEANGGGKSRRRRCCRSVDGREGPGEFTRLTLDEITITNEHVFKLINDMWDCWTAMLQGQEIIHRPQMEGARRWRQPDQPPRQSAS